MIGAPISNSNFLYFVHRSRIKYEISKKKPPGSLKVLKDMVPKKETKLNFVSQK